MRFEAEQLAKVLRHYVDDGNLALPAVAEYSLRELEDAIAREEEADLTDATEDQKAAARELQRIARLAEGRVIVAPIEAFSKCFEEGTVRP